MQDRPLSLRPVTSLSAPARGPVLGPGLGARGLLEALLELLVHPLRRVIPATGYIDWSSLVAAYVTALVYLFLLVASVGVSPI